MTVGWPQAGMMREGWKKYQKSRATDRDVARHICFTHDYMYNVLDTSPLPGGRAIWINDLKGGPESGVLNSSCAFCMLIISMRIPSCNQETLLGYCEVLPRNLMRTLLWHCIV